ncbi:MAG: 2-keto-4-pentenoate hydratase [Caulobacterales bacterium]
MTAANDNLAKLADSLFSARSANRAMGDADAHTFPGAPSSAYAVQDRLIVLEGGPTRYWKLGAPTIQSQAGLGLNEPFCGPMFTDVCQASPGRFATSTFPVHVFEPEIAIRLRADLDGAAEMTVARARAAIASMHPAIELINWRFGNTGKLGALAMIADYAANGGFVLGEAMPDDVDYWSLPLEVRINGAPVAHRTPPAPETDPASLLAWCARHLAARGYRLSAGDIITTGSQAGVLPYRPGDQIEVDFGPGGTVRARF